MKYQTIADQLLAAASLINEFARDDEKAGIKGPMAGAAKAIERREEDRPRSPDQILGELAQEDPVLAEYLSKKYGVPIKSAAETTRQEGALA